MKGKDWSVIRVLSAISNPIRLLILETLVMHGKMRYTDIMRRLRLDPYKDAGRFAYHLNTLVRSGLVTTNSDEYVPTELGLRVYGDVMRLEEILREDQRRWRRPVRFAHII